MPKSARQTATARTGATRWRAAIQAAYRAFGAVGLFSAAVNLLMLTGSIYMLQVYDRVLASGSVPTLLSLFAIVVILYTFLGAFDALRARLLSRVAHRLDGDLGTESCRAWLSGGTKAGQKTALDDLDAVRSFTASSAMRGLFDLPFVPLFVGVLFLIHPWLGWLTLAGAALTALAAWVGRVITAKALARGHSATAEARGFADGARRAMETTRAMGMQPRLVARWRDLQSRALVDTQTGGDRAETIAAGSKAFRMLLQSAILTLGAWLVIGGQISAGAIVAASILSGRALAPLDQAIGQWKSIVQAQSAFIRLRATVSAAPASDARATELPPPSGRITVSRLTKLVPGSERPLLNRIDFTLEPGDGLGVIGNSACGKSSLARCLVGAWSPDMGEVRLDGATLEQWDAETRGRYIGYLPQSVTLLPGTIRDNIARMDPDTDDATVITAARQAGIHDMILAMPEGYDTMVGADAPPLSGGQIQRIGLARAICGAPRIVVLDEPNANLDADGDAALSRVIQDMRAAGSTVVVMAHRPSAIAAVNKVMVMQNGAIARFGDKQDVLSTLSEAKATPPMRRTSDRKAAPAAGSAPAARAANDPQAANTVQKRAPAAAAAAMPALSERMATRDRAEVRTDAQTGVARRAQALTGAPAPQDRTLLTRSNVRVRRAGQKEAS